MDHDKFLREGKINRWEYEDYSHSFEPRISQILDKMCKKGLLNRDAQCEYELTRDGRDILATYFSIKGAG